MSFIEIFFIAIGLAMDAFAVAISRGVVLDKVDYKVALKFGAYFGGFQMLMPFIGWIFGKSFAIYLYNISHWVAMILLCFIGLNMLYEAIKRDENLIYIDDKNILKPLNMLTLAIATSIDAMAVGVGFAVMYDKIVIAALVIGAVAFVMSYLGVKIGKRLGKLFKKSAEIIGAIILIIIGIKIFFEHIL